MSILKYKALSSVLNLVKFLSFSKEKNSLLAISENKDLFVRTVGFFDTDTLKKEDFEESISFNPADISKNISVGSLESIVLDSSDKVNFTSHKGKIKSPVLPIDKKVELDGIFKELVFEKNETLLELTKNDIKKILSIPFSRSANSAFFEGKLEMFSDDGETVNIVRTNGACTIVLFKKKFKDKFEPFRIYCDVEGFKAASSWDKANFKTDGSLNKLYIDGVEVYFNGVGKEKKSFLNIMSYERIRSNIKVSETIIVNKKNFIGSFNNYKKISDADHTTCIKFKLSTNRILIIDDKPEEVSASSEVECRSALSEEIVLKVTLKMMNEFMALVDFSDAEEISINVAPKDSTSYYIIMDSETSEGDMEVIMLTAT